MVALKDLVEAELILLKYSACSLEVEAWEEVEAVPSEMDLEEEIHLEVAEVDFHQALSSLAEGDFQEDLALNFNEKKVLRVFKFFFY